MNKAQYHAMLEAFSKDPNSLVEYRKLYKFAYILSDEIFKIIFTAENNREELISLLNAILDLKGDKAIKTFKLELQEYPGVLRKKKCILDIIGTTSAGEKILVEVQQEGNQIFRDRVEYYVSRVIENQVHKSEKYELPKIYFVGLLDFELFPEEPTEYLHHVDEVCHGRPFFPKIQKIFVELGKFSDLDTKGYFKDDMSPVVEWLRFFKGVITEEPIPERIINNPTFRKLLEQLILSNFGDEVFNVEVHGMTDLAYEREGAFLDGKAKGKVEGLKEGERLAAEKAAKAMLVDGVPLGTVAKYTGLSTEEIEKLK